MLIPPRARTKFRTRSMKVYPEEFVDEYIRIIGGIVITGLCFLSLLSISALGLFGAYLMGWL